MATRQSIIGGPIGALFVNESTNDDTITGAPVFMNETSLPGATGTPPWGFEPDMPAVVRRFVVVST